MAIPETGAWPTRRSAVLDWLVHEARGQLFADNLFGEVCERLCAEGVLLARATLHLRTLHPQFMGASFYWRRDRAEVELRTLTHDILGTPKYLNSPIKALLEGAEAVRQLLHLPVSGYAYTIYDDLRAEGMTDYLALPLLFTSGQRLASTWATDRPGGFTTADISLLNELLPVLAMAVEIRANRRIAKNLLNTYVGKRAGERILAGEIRRGSGMTIRAAIWNCDLRGFTQISEQWPRDEVILWLNEYFDVMAEPVERHGGEILKFIGDGMLAIFPLETDEACQRALQAAIEAQDAMRRLNQERTARGQFELGFGVALHVGDVMYGNIGSQTRLDFTVIGPAVNVAARLQVLSRELRRQVLVSGAFAGLCACGTERLLSLGRFPLRGVDEPMEVHGLASER